MKMLLSKLTVILVTSTVLLSGCARDMGSNVYSSSAPVGKVLEGVVLSARPVTIKENDKLEENTMGMIGGGLVGGLAGSNIGRGSGNTAAIAGGALAGAALGSLVQSQLGKSKGMEYVVRLDPKYINQRPSTTTKTRIMTGDGSIDDEIKQSISVSETQTDLLSVVQGNDVILQPGQRVLVIYNNDRPRLAPAGY
jgi:outer membrane lipoprotein SlyB